MVYSIFRIALVSLLVSLSVSADSAHIQDIVQDLARQDVVYRGQGRESFELRDQQRTPPSDGSEPAEVLARVVLLFGNAPENTQPEETFQVTLDGDRLNVKVESSGRLLISQRVPRIQISRSARTVVIDAEYSFEFLDIAPVSEVVTVGLTRLELSNGTLRFEASPDFFENGFITRLVIARKRWIGTDRPLFDQTLESRSFTRTPTSRGKTLYSALLRELGAPSFPTGRYLMELFGRYDFESSSVLNARDLANQGRMSARLIHRF